MQITHTNYRVVVVDIVVSLLQLTQNESSVYLLTLYVMQLIKIILSQSRCLFLGSPEKAGMVGALILINFNHKILSINSIQLVNYSIEG